jgi:hypothetical protein
MSLKYFKTALPFQSAFMAAPYFCCKGCKSPLESGHCSIVKEAMSIHQLMRERQLRAKCFIVNQPLDTKHLKGGGTNNGNTAFSVSDFDVLRENQNCSRDEKSSL